MPIDVLCPACGQRLRVADAHAGKRARCPKCQGVVDVPATPAVARGWWMRTPEGHEYGPVTKPALDAWHAEGRIVAECQFRAPGQTNWVPAATVYADLAGLVDDGPLLLAQTAESGSYEVDEVPGKSPPPLGAGVNPLGRPYSPHVEYRPSGENVRGFSGTDVERALAQTRPWVLFQGIVGLILGVISLLSMLASMGQAARAGGLAVFITLLGLLFVGLGLYTAYLLVAYASRTKDFLFTGSPESLEEALLAQQKYWQLMGILMIVVLVLMGFAFVVGAFS